MRRPAAALASALLAASVLAPSTASAAPLGPGCAGAETPTCAVIDQVRALLGPLQPVVDLAVPALADLGSAVNHLDALLGSGSDASPSDVAAAAGAVLDQLGALSAPLLDLLASRGADVGALESAVAQLEDLAEGQLAPAGDPAPAPATSEASSAPATSAGGSGPTSFGGVLSAAGVSSPDATTSPAVPDVPVGGTLDLGPLALPRYSFTGTPAASADELAMGAAVAALVLPAVAAAATPEVPDSSRATAAVLAVCVLMLAAGLLLDQRQKARLPIRL